MEWEYPEGATPLPEDGRDDLIPDLTLQGELNEFEQKNIVQSLLWASGNRAFSQRILTPGGLCELHRKMFDLTWKWAGSYRQHNLNLGIPWPQIAENVILVCQDTWYWIDSRVYDWPELVVRFHHRMVQIHPFPNGNGRHARLAADLILEYHDQPGLAWGKGNLQERGSLRSNYISALKEADSGDIDPLILFALGKQK